MTKRTLVYSLDPYWVSLFLLDEAEAQPLCRDVKAVRACTTVGEIRALLPHLKNADEEGILDLLEGRSDEEAWSWEELPGAADGDWPPMPTGLTLALFKESSPEWKALTSLPGVDVGETRLNGDGLVIPPGLEAQMVAALQTLGHEVRRDDELLAPLLVE